MIILEPLDDSRFLEVTELLVYGFAHLHKIISENIFVCHLNDKQKKNVQREKC